MENKEQVNSSENREELTTLKGALRQAIDDGDMQRAGELKAEILPRLNAMKENLLMEPEKAREIMRGVDYFGPEAVERAFGIRLKEYEIPNVPFSREDLERARVLNQFLVLRVNKKEDGSPLTISDMQGDRITIKNFEEVPPGEGSPRAGWALVEKEPHDAPRNYLEETQDLITYIEKCVFGGLAMPREYQTAIQEFKDRQGLIKKFSERTPRSFDVANLLTDLGINKLSRQNISEAVYDVCIFFINHKKNEPNMLYATSNVRTKSDADNNNIYELRLDGFSTGPRLENDTITLGIGKSPYTNHSSSWNDVDQSFVFSRRS
jgi:hypothetical protein